MEITYVTLKYISGLYIMFYNLLNKDHAQKQESQNKRRDLGSFLNFQKM